MKYFKNTELAKLYHVSEKTVRNWIQAAQEGRLNLQLHEENDKLHIANTLKNTAFIEELVQKGKKYKNTRGAKTLIPKKDFYDIYDQRQIWDIISNLTVHKEIPLQYGYADGGAISWDHYANRLIREEIPNILTRTIELLDIATENVEQLTSGYGKVNVVDLGSGNGLPIRPTLERLLEQGRLNRYIAIDISQEMLNILQKNIQTWFGDQIAFEGYVRDISYERFNDLLINDTTNDEIGNINLVHFLGATLNNFRAPSQVLQAINNSLGPNDLLLYTGFLDTPKTRRYFDLSGIDEKDPQQSGLIPDLWSMNDSLCDFELLFDASKGSRFKKMSPKVDLSIQLELGVGIRNIELKKNEPILLWRHNHYTAVDLINLFDENDFDLLQATKSVDRDYLLLISKIKTQDSLE